MTNGWEAAQRADGVAGAFLARWTLLLGGEAERFGCATALAVPDQPDVGWMQTVVGLTPREVDYVPAIVDWYRHRRLFPTFELLPAQEFQPLADALMRAGARPSGFSDVLVGGVTHTLDVPLAVEVRPVEPGSADVVTFARVLLGGHEVPADAEPMNWTAVERWASEPGWRCYLALVDGAPIGTAVLAVDGDIGYLANAATLPHRRRRGAHSALVARRLVDAASAGCVLTCSFAAPWSASRRNLERAGLRVAETKTLWRMR